MKKLIIIFMSVLLGFLTGCESFNKENLKEKSFETEIFAMDTYMTLTAYGDKAEEAVKKGEQTIKNLDFLLSVGDKKSEIFHLNSTGKSKVSNETIKLLNKSLEINKKTKNAFNPAVYPLIKLWGFADKNYNVPDETQIKNCLAKTNVKDIEINKNSSEISLKKDGMGIDFGGIAKGYASSKIIDIFKNLDVENGMINLGGNVQVLGGKTDGTPWNVAIQNPENSSDYLGIIKAKDKAIITSGGYERYFEKNGKRYHHIIDPKTGSPAKSDLKSVTIISNDGTLADAYSTSLFVMGFNKAVDFWRNNQQEFDAVFYTCDNKLLVTKGLEKSFSSDLDYKVIS